MRGVVSLAAALSIPHMVNHQPFPQRNLILFITFVVILITLVLQGLTLPLVIKFANLKDPDYKISDTDQELLLQKKLARYAIDHIKSRYKDQMESNDLLRGYYQRLQNKLFLLENMSNSESFDEGENTLVKGYESVRNEILEGQRKLLENFNKRDGMSEDIIKKYLLILDQQEAQLNEQLKLF